MIIANNNIAILIIKDASDIGAKLRLGNPAIGPRRRPGQFFKRFCGVPRGPAAGIAK
jgi:hypothetical protein